MLQPPAQGAAISAGLLQEGAGLKPDSVPSCCQHRQLAGRNNPRGQGSVPRRQPELPGTCRGDGALSGGSKSSGFFSLFSPLFLGLFSSFHCKQGWELFPSAPASGHSRALRSRSQAGSSGATGHWPRDGISSDPPKGNSHPTTNRCNTQARRKSSLALKKPTQ